MTSCLLGGVLGLLVLVELAWHGRRLLRRSWWRDDRSPPDPDATELTRTLGGWEQFTCATSSFAGIVPVPVPNDPTSRHRPMRDIVLAAVAHLRVFRAPDLQRFGVLDRARLELATRRMMQRHPALRVNVDFGAAPPGVRPPRPRYRPVWTADELQAGCPPALSRLVRIVPRGSATAWQGLLAEELGAGFDDPELPLWRVVVLQDDASDASDEAEGDGEPNVDVLIVYHHAVGDGMCVHTLIDDLLTFHHTPDPDAAVMPLPPTLDVVDLLHATVPAPTWFRFASALLAPVVEIVARNTRPDFPHLDRRAPPDRYTTAQVYRLGTAEGRARLQAACRERGVTVGAAIAAAQCFAISVWHGAHGGSRRLDIPFAINLRARVGKGETWSRSIGNFTASDAYRPKLEPGTRFWDLARRCHAHARRSADGLLPRLVTYALWQHCFPDPRPVIDFFATSAPGACSQGAYISNIGNHAGSRGFGGCVFLENLRLVQQWTPVCALWGGLFIVTVDAIALSYQYSPQHERDDTAAAIVDAILGLIESDEVARKADYTFGDFIRTADPLLRMADAMSS